MSGADGKWRMGLRTQTHPRPDFMPVQTRQLSVIGLCEALFDGPAATNDLDQFLKRCSKVRVSENVSQVSGIYE